LDVIDIPQRIEDQRQHHLAGLLEFLRIPSISTLPERRDDMRRCADFVAAEMRQAGLSRVEVLPTGGHPVVYGEWVHAPDKPTILVYGHYDVQPVDPIEKWDTPPFEPTIRDGQIFARGAADDKGQVYIHLKAVETYLSVAGHLPINVKFLIEGEEEIGSEHLDSFISTNRDLLRADLAVISDTDMFARGQPSMVYGLRGLTYLQVDLDGPSSDLHSGVFGGAVANPAQVLAAIIASLKDDDGRVTVPGFYDDVRPLTADEREAYALLPFDEEAYRADLGVQRLHGEPGYTTLERLSARPTLDVNGMWSGFTGEGAKTVLPSRASAKISCRLVPDQSPDKIYSLLEGRLRELCPPTVTMTITNLHGARPVITPLDHPAVRAASRALERAFGKKPLFTREGGSIPVVATFEDLLGIPTVLLGFALPDAHMHAPNERFDVENFHLGIRTVAFLLEELAEVPLSSR
jgi:acetylornithine deacetylase/succinyl-diaminopimelate desuccinylase-like protein